MKSALIIGGTGLLGRGVARVLKTRNWEVTLLTRGQKPLPVELQPCKQITADRSQPDSLVELAAGRGFDLVVDCAAYSKADAEGAFHTFHDKVHHYWFISTDFVYDAAPDARYPLRETAQTQSRLPYAANKLEAETFLLEKARTAHFPVTILRPPHILGAGRPTGCDPAAGGRDATLIERIRSGQTIDLLAGGLYLIQPMWSQELGHCIDQLSGQSTTLGKCFNIAGPECITILEYYQMIARWAEVPLKINAVGPAQFAQEHPEQTHLLRHRIYDISELKSAGYSPSLSLAEAFEDTLGTT